MNKKFNLLWAGLLVPSLPLMAVSCNNTGKEDDGYKTEATLDKSIKASDSYICDIDLSKIDPEPSNPNSKKFIESITAYKGNAYITYSLKQKDGVTYNKHAKLSGLKNIDNYFDQINLKEDDININDKNKVLPSDFAEKFISNKHIVALKKSLDNDIKFVPRTIDVNDSEGKITIYYLLQKSMYRDNFTEKIKLESVGNITSDIKSIEVSGFAKKTVTLQHQEELKNAKIESISFKDGKANNLHVSASPADLEIKANNANVKIDIVDIVKIIGKITILYTATIDGEKSNIKTYNLEVAKYTSLLKARNSLSEGWNVETKEASQYDKFASELLLDDLVVKGNTIPARVVSILNPNDITGIFKAVVRFESPDFASPLSVPIIVRLNNIKCKSTKEIFMHIQSEVDVDNKETIKASEVKKEDIKANLFTPKDEWNASYPLFYNPGIEVIKLTPNDDTGALEVKYKIVTYNRFGEASRSIVLTQNLNGFKK